MRRLLCVTALLPAIPGGRVAGADLRLLAPPGMDYAWVETIAGDLTTQGTFQGHQRLDWPQTRTQRPTERALVAL